MKKLLIPAVSAILVVGTPAFAAEPGIRGNVTANTDVQRVDIVTVEGQGGLITRLGTVGATIGSPPINAIGSIVVDGGTIGGDAYLRSNVRDVSVRSTGGVTAVGSIVVKR